MLERIGASALLVAAGQKVLTYCPTDFPSIFSGRKGGMLGIPTIEKYLANLPDTNNTTVVLGSGEPLMHYTVAIQAAEQIRNSGGRSVLVTDGHQLDRVIEQGALHLFSQIDIMLHQNLVPDSDGARRVLDAVEVALECGIPVNWLMYLSSEINEVADALTIAATLSNLPLFIAPRPIPDKTPVKTWYDSQLVSNNYGSIFTLFPSITGLIDRWGNPYVKAAKTALKKITPTVVKYNLPPHYGYDVRLY